MPVLLASRRILDWPTTSIKSVCLCSLCESFSQLPVCTVDWSQDERPYILAELPANLVLRKIGPKVLMPSLLTIWGMMVTLQGCYFAFMKPLHVLNNAQGWSRASVAFWLSDSSLVWLRVQCYRALFSIYRVFIHARNCHYGRKILYSTHYELLTVWWSAWPSSSHLPLCVPFDILSLSLSDTFHNESSLAHFPVYLQLGYNRCMA